MHFLSCKHKIFNFKDFISFFHWRNDRHIGFRNVLETNANQIFENQKLELFFSSDEFDWRPVSFTTCYEFSGQKIEMKSFSPLTNDRNLKLTIDLKAFDRHCLHDCFTFEINFVYAEDENATVRTVKYRSDVSKKETFQILSPVIKVFFRFLISSSVHN